MTTTRSTIFHTLHFTLLRPMTCQLCCIFFVKAITLEFWLHQLYRQSLKSYLAILPILIVDHSNTARESGFCNQIWYHASRYDCHTFLISVIYPILKCITIKQGCKHHFFIFACFQIENERLSYKVKLQTLS